MLKDIIENIKWYDKLYYQNQKVRFTHEKDYEVWLNDKVKNHSERRIVDYFIKQNKLDKIINKAINDEKIINSHHNRVCIYCLKSKIKLVFYKDILELKTVLAITMPIKNCNVIYVNESILERLEYKYNETGFFNDDFVENYADVTYIHFDCEDSICLDI